MPDTLGEATTEERATIAEAITDFLVSRSEERFRRSAPVATDVAAGERLFNTVGCIACHSPLEETRPESTNGLLKLSHVSEKYSVSSLSDFLFRPLAVRASGRMPDMSLTRAEAKAVASYLIGAKPQAENEWTLDRSRIEEGRAYFEEYRCSVCHSLDGLSPVARAPKESELNPGRGCLSSEDSGSAPRYGFSEDQITALRTSLSAASSTPTASPSEAAEAPIAMTLTAFNCIACHSRNDYGGVAASTNLLFTTSEPSLGDEARIPPQLTGVGAKLRGDWLRAVLFDRATVRPYMHTRMPQHGEDNLASLVGYLRGVDTIPPHELRPPPQKQRGEIRDAGRKLVGDEALNCVTCHNFNGKESPGYKGMDLITSYERLQPSWFYRFMRNPNAIRPNITMPNNWEDPDQIYDDILNGDVDAQIEAMWYYLSLGRSAPDPSGIRRVSTRLEVEDVTRVYRGRSRVAGYRGIAVGFPGGLNYAFNANTGSLAALWSGDYVTVNWSGQGAGGFNPAARTVSLPQDVTFMRLDDAKAPWPLRPKMTKEKPVNPDPTYPRNYGYRFGGYQLDQSEVPTFLYSSGDVQIADRSEPDFSGEHPVLIRTLLFDSPRDETLWFRALTGEIESLSDQQFAVGRLKVTLPAGRFNLRPLEPGATEKGTSKTELVQELTLPQGTSTVTIRYELR